MLEYVAFGVIATVMLSSAMLAVGTKDLVRSVLWLGLSLVATAALYVSLSAPFVAAIQIILYTGGIITLMLFALLLTRESQGVVKELRSSRRGLGALASAAVFGVLAAMVFKSHGESLPTEPPSSFEVSTNALATSILGDHLLAFEALSLLLLAALVGAVVLARRSDP